MKGALVVVIVDGVCLYSFSLVPFFIGQVADDQCLGCVRVDRNAEGDNEESEHEYHKESCRGDISFHI